MSYICSLTLVTLTIRVKLWYRDSCAVSGENNNCCYVLQLLFEIRNLYVWVSCLQRYVK